LGKKRKNGLFQTIDIDLVFCSPETLSQPWINFKKVSKVSGVAENRAKIYHWTTISLKLFCKTW